MEQQSPNKMTRVTVYLDEAEHRLLKSVLALEGTSVSEWVRRLIKGKIAKNK